jgi:hypothetical protein
MYTVTSVFVYTTGVTDPVVANSSRLVLKRAMKFSVADVVRAYVRVSNGPVLLPELPGPGPEGLLVRHVSSIWYS